MIQLNINKDNPTQHAQAVYFHPYTYDIFIDLNKSVSTNACNDIVGETEITSEFYFHDGFLSKIKLEAPSRLDFHLLSGQESLDVFEMSKADITSPVVLSNKKAIKLSTCPNIENLLISLEQDFFLFLFETEDSYLTEEGLCYDEISVVQLNDQIRFGISDKNNEFDKYSLKGNLLSDKELGEDSYLKLQNIIKESIEFSSSAEEFENLIGKLQNKPEDHPLMNSILERLLSRYQAEKSIYTE
jgi:hypothetical protein